MKNPNDLIEMNRRIEKEAREEKDKGGGVVRLGTGGGSTGIGVADVAGIVSRETAVAGTASTAARSDGTPGNMLAGSPGDGIDDAATLNPSLEYVKKTAGDRRGQRVKIGTTYVAGGVGEVADLEAKAATAGPDSKSGLVVRLGAGLVRLADGIALDPDDVSTGTLYVDHIAEKTAGHTVTFDNTLTIADGKDILPAVNVTSDIGDPTHAFQSMYSSHLSLIKDVSDLDAPELHFVGHTGSWIIGIDVANHGGGRDFVLAARKNGATVHDVIYLNWGDGTDAVSIGLGQTPPPGNSYRTYIAALDDTVTMGELAIRVGPSQTGHAWVVTDSNPTAKLWCRSDFFLQSANTGGLCIKANASDEALLMAMNAAATSYGFYFPSGGGGALRFKYTTGGVDIFTFLTTGALQVHGATTMVSTLDCWDALTMATDKKVVFRDSALFISSKDDGHLDIDADTSIDLNATSVVFSGKIDGGISGMTAESSVADADVFPFYDATATANRKVTAANLKTYCQSGTGTFVALEGTHVDNLTGHSTDWQTKDLSATYPTAKAFLIYIPPTGNPTLWAGDSGHSDYITVGAGVYSTVVIPCSEAGKFIYKLAVGDDGLDVKLFGYWT